MDWLTGLVDGGESARTTASKRNGSQYVVVVGDVLLDVDVVGDVQKVAPDAPVPVLGDLITRYELGGAGRSARLAREAGCPVCLVTAVGRGRFADAVRALLDAAGIELLDLGRRGEVPTKVRIRGGNQTILRLDTGPIGDNLIAGRAQALVAEVLQGKSAIVVADYGNGVAEMSTIRSELEATSAPVVWDPHPRGPKPVPRATLITPNSAEAKFFSAPLKEHGSAFVDDSLRAQYLRKLWDAKGVAVTMGESGAVLAREESVESLAVVARSVREKEVVGAGDVFSMTAAIALAGGYDIGQSVERAVEAASAYVSGVAWYPKPPWKTEPAVDLTQIQSFHASGGVVVCTCGCFDLLHSGHVRLLEQARRLGDCLIVLLNSDSSVRQLKGSNRPIEPFERRREVLMALNAVDVVVELEQESPIPWIQRIRPDIWVKGGDYVASGVAEASAVREVGGEVILLPYHEGLSTSGIIGRIAALQQPEQRK